MSADQMLPQVERIAARDGMRCHYCDVELSLPGIAGFGSRQPVATRDHVVPRSKGGCNHDANIVLACGPCNRAKASRIPGELRAAVSSRKADDVLRALCGHGAIPVSDRRHRRQCGCKSCDECFARAGAGGGYQAAVGD